MIKKFFFIRCLFISDQRPRATSNNSKCGPTVSEIKSGNAVLLGLSGVEE